MTSHVADCTSRAITPNLCSFMTGSPPMEALTRPRCPISLSDGRLEDGASPGRLFRAPHRRLQDCRIVTGTCRHLSDAGLLLSIIHDISQYVGCIHEWMQLQRALKTVHHSNIRPRSYLKLRLA